MVIHMVSSQPIMNSKTMVYANVMLAHPMSAQLSSHPMECIGIVLANPPAVN